MSKEKSIWKHTHTHTLYCSIGSHIGWHKVPSTAQFRRIFLEMIILLFVSLYMKLYVRTYCVEIKRYCLHLTKCNLAHIRLCPVLFGCVLCTWIFQLLPMMMHAIVHCLLPPPYDFISLCARDRVPCTLYDYAIVSFMAYFIISYSPLNDRF